MLPPSARAGSKLSAIPRSATIAADAGALDDRLCRQPPIGDGEMDRERRIVPTGHFVPEESSNRGRVCPARPGRRQSVMIIEPLVKQRLASGFTKRLELALILRRAAGEYWLKWFDDQTETLSQGKLATTQESTSGSIPCLSPSP